MPPYREVDILKRAGYEVWICCRVHTYSDPVAIATELQDNLNAYLSDKGYSFSARTKVDLETNKIYVKKIRTPSWTKTP